MEIEREVGELLRALGMTLATAESCTGGLMGHRIVSVPGSSDYFAGGLIAYSYEAKEILLGVRHETLVAHGAVSEETAREMARGARFRLGADVAVSITGIAGPTGATPDKPVGLVYLALSAEGEERCERHVWQGNRRENNRSSVRAALRLVRAYLRETEERRPPVEAPASPAAEDKDMLEFLNEPVTVELRAREGKSPRPLAFHWQGRRYAIESWGREGQAPRGGHDVYCTLVQTAGPETWELCVDQKTAQWTLTRHWAAGSARA